MSDAAKRLSLIDNVYVIGSDCHPIPIPNDLKADIKAVLKELEECKKHFEEQWLECHDGSEIACMKMHE